MKNKGIKESAAQIRLLTEQFYTDYTPEIYDQILHKKDGRGYGIFLIPLCVGYIEESLSVFSPADMFVFSAVKSMEIIQQYDFAIPLHSNIKKGFILDTLHFDGKVQHKGLDYNKAVIIRPEHIGRTYNLDRPQFNRINAHKKIISRDFLKYLTGYIDAVCADNQNILKRDYIHSTFPYFHRELHLPENPYSK